MSGTEDNGKAIVIRDRRKPNQYTTDNVIAREWLSILRVGDAFSFYSVYLSMANKETESSWGSLRTLAKYLQCSIDLIIRGNKLLETCELIHIETGNQHTSNKYYILDPPALTEDLKDRIYQRLDDILATETSKNWQAWAKQVGKRLDNHRSLPSIWAERRAKRGGRPPKTLRPENPACEPQTQFLENPACDSLAGRMWDTSRALVSHEQAARDSQVEQEQVTEKKEQSKEKNPDSLVQLVCSRCRSLGVSSQVISVLLENHESLTIATQLDWLPFRHAREPAAMLVSAVQNHWSRPAQYDSEQAQAIWAKWLEPVRELDEAYDDVGLATVQDNDTSSGDDTFALTQTGLGAQEVWPHVLDDLSMQMTRATFDTWLSGSQVVAVREDEIVVRVRDIYAVDWLRARWLAPIERTLAGVVGHPLSIRFEV